MARRRFGCPPRQPPRATFGPSRRAGNPAPGHSASLPGIDQRAARELADRFGTASRRTHPRHYTRGVATMAVSYLGALENVFGQGLTSGIASQTGEPEQNVTRGLKSSVAAVFAGLVGKLGDVRGFQGIYEMITSRDDVALLREYDDPTSFAARFATGDSAVPNVVTQFTSAIFGTRTTQVGDLVARESGLSANTTAKLLPLASGFVMNFLRRRIVTDGLNLNTFRDTLLGQKDEIMRAAPAGLTEVLGAQPAPEEMRTVNDVREREVSYERIEADRRYRETPRETRRETEREL
ncbi:MAG TPA: DUF937 domain-containing protein, partial [Gemmatimonadaceae bacterium]|nr:DUF937 domain-containing protein [Gemmatimonadaceae bacterium]